MPDTHSEIEIKFVADDVDMGLFNRWCMRKKPVRYEHVFGPDVYYVQGHNTVRHRWNIGTAGELTVKRRKSAGDVTDRVEIDLSFGPTTNINDVTQFLLATGWKRTFTLMKEAHIFWYDDPVPMTLVIYEAGKLANTGAGTKVVEERRFIECEIEKGSSLSPETSREELLKLERELKDVFGVGQRSKLSLYEIYSGKRYEVLNPIRYTETGEPERVVKKSRKRNHRRGA